MSGNKFSRLNAKGVEKQDGKVPDEPSKPVEQQPNKPTNTLTNKPTNTPSFSPSFANLPNGSGVELSVEQLRRTLVQVGKESRSFTLLQAEKDALDRATFLLKIQGMKVDANKIARVALTKALADLDEKGADSFLYQMLDNLSN